ncbi:MAG: cold shock domain-containing protein [Bacteroidales bacterium]
MGRSQESFQKKEVRKKKDKKRKDKEKKKQERKENENKSAGFDDMIAYVDEYGNITDTPRDEQDKEEIAAEDIELSAKKEDNDENHAPGEKTGVVEFYNDSKGYGFIREDQTKFSIFVHATNLLEEIAEGNKVIFEKAKGDKGPIALNVKVVR